MLNRVPCVVFHVSPRWPWPLFKLMDGPLHEPSNVRKQVATQLLQTSDLQVDHTTRKIKLMCAKELRHVQATGCLTPGSLLHAILSVSALNMSLDAGELESLNSMIKTSMAQANNTGMSLELLSSRVNSRKTITLASGGRTRLRDVKPVASSLSSHATLYHGMEKDIISDTYRWSPPKPITISASKPHVYDPSLKLSHAQLWAVKHNKILMGKFHDHQKQDSTMFAGFMFKFPTHDSTFLVAELAGRTCQVQLLEPRVMETPDRLQVWLMPQQFAFQSSIDAIASTHSDTKSVGKKGIPMCFVTLRRIDLPSDCRLPVFRFCFVVHQASVVSTLLYRKPRTVKPPTSSPNASDVNMPPLCAEGAPSSSNDVDTQPTLPEGPAGEAAFEDDALEQELIDQLELELAGDVIDDSLLAEFENDLRVDEQGKDNCDMDDLHTKFVAAAVTKQHESNFCDIASSRQTSEFEDRPFEDNVAEEVLDHFMQEHMPESTASTAGRSHSAPSRSATASLPRLSELDIQECLHKWNRSAQTSMKACERMAESLNHFEADNLGSVLSHELSLVLHCAETAEVSFVSWTTPFHKLRGRVVTLDDTNCVMYPSNFRPPVDFAGSIMVAPCVGARVRKKGREQMSGLFLRLQKMICAAIDSAGELDTHDELDFDTHDDVGGRLQCAACGQGGDVAKLRQCAHCLLQWHEPCSAQVRAHTSSYMVTHDVKSLAHVGLSAGHLPFVFLPGAQLGKRMAMVAVLGVCCVLQILLGRTIIVGSCYMLVPMRVFVCQTVSVFVFAQWEHRALLNAACSLFALDMSTHAHMADSDSSSLCDPTDPRQERDDASPVFTSMFPAVRPEGERAPDACIVRRAMAADMFTEWSSCSGLVLLCDTGL